MGEYKCMEYEYCAATGVIREIDQDELWGDSLIFLREDPNNRVYAMDNFSNTVDVWYWSGEFRRANTKRISKTELPEYIQMAILIGAT